MKKKHEEGRKEILVSRRLVKPHYLWTLKKSDYEI
jgi:hypothetical protein